LSAGRFPRSESGDPFRETRTEKGREKEVDVKRLLLGGIGIALVYAVVQNIPDVARYLKIRSM
jgi:hypothetical protein